MSILKKYNKLLITLLSISLLSLISACDTQDRQSDQVTVAVVDEVLTIQNKPVELFNIIQADGTSGVTYFGGIGDQFDMIIENKSSAEYTVHPHGVILPNEQDGVPFVTQLPDQPGDSRRYHFQLVQTGSYWMHSHLGLQIGQLFAAPLVIKDPRHPYDQYEDVVMFLQDFSFEHTGVIDELFTNRRTTDDPDIVPVQVGQVIRLRVFNGSTNSNFYLELGELTGKLIATDGQYIEPVVDKVFEIAVAQRLDILLTIPEGESAYPIIARREKDTMQTGLILATIAAEIPELSAQADNYAEEFDYSQELQFRTLLPLVETPVRRILLYNLDRNEDEDTWTMNEEIWPAVNPKEVEAGERVKIVLQNNTDESHPMHLHGHVFQVTRIEDQEFRGALRDTVLVLPFSTVEIQFNSERSGIWMFHCHKLMHQQKGMMTTINYEGYPAPDYYLDLIGKNN